MSKWIRGIYNAAANFNMSGSLRAAAARTMDRGSRHVRESSNERDQHVESSQSSESGKLGNSTNGASSAATGRSSVIVGNDVIITDSRDICDTECHKCHPTFCDHIERDYLDYISNSSGIRTEGQGASSWIRVSNEPRHFERTDNTTRADVEHVTGIPTGVTI
jgi:hypothetical protein